MSGLDALPPDQRAVLQLVLRKGRSYDTIARALRLQPEAVRTRAHDGLAALVPSPGLDADERASVADWLLGQHRNGAGAGTQRLLTEDPDARRWAEALTAELRPLADRELPELPPAPEPSPPDRTAPRVSRRGGAILLAAIALLAVIVVVILALRDNGGSSDSTSSPAAGAPTSSASDGRVVAQINLKAPAGAPAPKALGVVQVVPISGRQAINALVQGLPQTKKSGYGIWLLGDGGDRRWLGYFRTADQKGRLVAQGRLDQGLDVTAYSRMLVTRETAAPPKQPGTVYLRGTIVKPPAGQQGGG